MRSRKSRTIAPLRRLPAPDAELWTQALRGERVTIYDRNGEGFAWGQLGSDGYVGWLPESTLTKTLSSPTHKVMALWTFAFAGPQPLDPLTQSTLVDGLIFAVLGACLLLLVRLAEWIDRKAKPDPDVTAGE